MVARNLLTAALQPVQIAGQQCRVTASIGIALYPDDAQDAATLLKNADMAMYRAKEEGKNGFQFYSPTIGARLRAAAADRNRPARGALARDEISLHYQAKVDISTGEIRGVEALLRWTHPELGVGVAGAIHPDRRRERADRADRPLGVDGGLRADRRLASGRDCRHCAWPSTCHRDSFMDPHLVDIDSTGARRTRACRRTLLELEITESVMMHDLEAAIGS